MMPKIFKELLDGLRTTGSVHRKKVIGIAILAIAFGVARKRVRIHHIVSVVMFLYRISSRVVGMLPTPMFGGYRKVMGFSYEEQEGMPQLVQIMRISELLSKIKSNMKGAIDELKLCVISGTVLNIIMYNATSLYELIKKKYYADFEALGAAHMFEDVVAALKHKFTRSLLAMNTIVTSQLHDRVKAISLDEPVDLPRIRALFQTLIDHIFHELEDTREKFWSKKTAESSRREYRVAQHFFTSTKELLPGRAEDRQPGRPLLRLLAAPLRLLNKVLEQPEEELTPLRFECTEYLYVLCLKQFRVQGEWPNLESKYLFAMVLEELIGWFHSINFSILMKKHSELNLSLFVNRVGLYFARDKSAAGPRTLPLKTLLSVFYKICDEEIVKKTNQQSFYQRQLFNAFKDIKTHNRRPDSLHDYHRRNGILLEVYCRNQFEHLDRDMQAKFFNERDAIMVNPMPRASQPEEQKDDIQQLLEGFEMMKDHNAKDLKKQTAPNVAQLWEQENPN